MKKRKIADVLRVLRRWSGQAMKLDTLQHCGWSRGWDERMRINVDRCIFIGVNVSTLADRIILEAKAYIGEFDMGSRCVCGQDERRKKSIESRRRSRLHIGRGFGNRARSTYAVLRAVRALYIPSVCSSRCPTSGRLGSLYTSLFYAGSS